MPIIFIVINIKQDVLEARRGGNRTRDLLPRYFLESPGAEQRPAHQAKFWGWDNSSKGLPMYQKNPRKLSKVEKQKCRKIFCKMVSLKKSLKSTQSGLFQKAEKSWNLPQWGESQRCISYFALGVAHTYVSFAFICNNGFYVIIFT